LSQTIGLCNADRYIISPFKLINTYINIPDCKGKESLFQAEMNRCIYYLENIKKLDGRNEYAFNIMDEVFSGTNPLEGLSGAYAYIHELCKYKNNINLITTHYDYLSNLEYENDNIKNYHFQIINDNDNDNNDNNNIQFTYKITSGKSEKKIALELLNCFCFNNDMKNKSIEIFDKIVKL
jgi:DNA mismatch repair ATPase MutS